MREEVELLEDHPDLAPQLKRAAALLALAASPGPYSTPSTRTEPALGSSSRLIVRRSGRLARARRAEDDDVLALVDGQVDAVQHLVRAERLLDALELDDDLRRGICGAPCSAAARPRDRTASSSGRVSA